MLYHIFKGGQNRRRTPKTHSLLENVYNLNTNVYNIILIYFFILIFGNMNNSYQGSYKYKYRQLQSQLVQMITVSGDFFQVII